MKYSLLLLAAIGAPAAAQPASAPPPRPVAAPSPAAATRPTFPGVIQGAIAYCNCNHGEHRVPLQAGRRYAIGATSRTFDPYLQLLLPATGAVLAEDDDSGEGVSPSLIFTAPATGEYLVRVSSASRGGAGQYALNVQPLAPLPPLLAQPTRVQAGQWQLFENNLAAGNVENGRRYQDYELRLAAGETAMIHARGQQELDTMLQIFPLSARGNKPVAENDDAGAGLDSALVFTATQAGTYVVRVSGPADQVQAAYRLRIGR
jgi:hypothetical protein